MSLNESDTMPIVFISAVDTNAAEAVITELTEKEETSSDGGRVWRLENKYYTALVLLLPVPDPPAVPAPAATRSTVKPEAHVIYLTETECASGAAAAALERRAGAGEGEVLLAVCECAAPPPALAAAAVRRRYELVPLLTLPPPTDPAEPFPELRGWARAREALHAHTWPGLQLRPRQTRGPAKAGPPATHAEAEADEEAEAVERAEQFADALAALAAARELPAAARRDHAGELLAVFARALGLSDHTDLDQL